MVKLDVDTITAYDLAKRLAECLAIDVQISSKVDKDAYFQFDADKGTMLAARIAVSDIAASEKGNPRTAASYKAVLKLADGAFGSCAERIPEAVRYAIFCCLHEFGHCYQSIEWTTDELHAQDAVRKEMCAAAKEEAQTNADNGLLPGLVFQIFENKYRSIPIEKDADRRALAMVKPLLDIWRGC